MMKRFALRWFAFALLVLASRPALGQWTPHTILTDVQGSGEFSDLAADSAGNLHAAYWNRYRDRLMYGFLPAGSTDWTLTEVDPDHAGGFRSAIALDANGLPGIAYYENVGQKAELRFAKRSAGGSWLIQTVSRDYFGGYGPEIPVADPRIQPSIDLQFQEDNEPLILFFDGKTKNCASSFKDYETDILDDFSRPDNARVGQTLKKNKIWTEFSDTPNENVKIKDQQLKIEPGTLTGGAGAMVETNYVLPNNSVTSSVTDVFEWSFNMRSSYAKHTGFGMGQAGAAFVLASNVANCLDAGEGYALVLADTSDGDSLKLVRFINGLRGVHTVILAVPNVTNQYLTVKITFNGYAANTGEFNTWRLYLKKNSGFFEDPRTLTVETERAVYPDAQTSLARYMGFVWSYPGASLDSFLADNLYTSTSPYGLEMQQAYRNKATGEWLYRSFGDFPVWNSSDFYSMQCEGKIGSRYGEFCQLVKDVQGKFNAFTFEKINANMLHFRQTTDSVTWLRREIDSVQAINTLTQMERPGMTFEGTSAIATPDGRLHVCYTLSEFYGRNLPPAFYDNVLRYVRTTPTGAAQVATIYPINAADKRDQYLSSTCLAAHRSDTLFISFASQEDNKYLLAVSYDAGANWQVVEMASAALPNQKAPIVVANGKLHGLYFDKQTSSLFYGYRDLAPANAPWTFKALTQTSLSGTSLSSLVVNGKIYVAYNDEPARTLNFAEQIEDENFAIQTLPTPIAGVYNYLSLVQTASGAFKLYFADPTQQRVSQASRAAAAQQWTFQTIDPTVSGDYIKAAAQGETVHLVYFDANQRGLVYKKIVNDQVTVTETVDGGGTDGFAGEYAALTLDAAGDPHVAYYDRKMQGLKYAYRNAALNAWQTDSLFAEEDVDVGQHNAIAIGPNGKVQIAFRHVTKNKIMLAYQRPDNSWAVETAVNDGAGSLGVPISLQIDSSSHAWIAYNVTADNDQIQIVRKRYNDKLYDPFPVFNNVDNIGRSFDFHLQSNRLYLVGRRNRELAQGLGWLEREGWTEIPSNRQDPAAFTDLKVYPNPFNEQAVCAFQLLQPARARVELLNLHGQTVETVFDGECAPGSNALPIDGSRLPAGVYLCRLTANGQTTVWKMVKQ